MIAEPTGLGAVVLAKDCQFASVSPLGKPSYWVRRPYQGCGDLWECESNGMVTDWRSLVEVVVVSEGYYPTGVGT